MRRRSACWPIVLAALLSLTAVRVAAATFDVTRTAGIFHVEASAEFAADLHVVWDALTDYEGLPRFVPGIRRVRVLERYEQAGEEHLIVEQLGEFRFLFFAQRITVLLDVRQVPTSSVRALALPQPPRDAAEASLNSFEATYTLLRVPGGVRLEYRANFAPNFDLPPLLGWLAVRQTMQAQFEAMLAEIDRRQLAFAAREGVAP